MMKCFRQKRRSRILLQDKEFDVPEDNKTCISHSVEDTRLVSQGDLFSDTSEQDFNNTKEGISALAFNLETVKNSSTPVDEPSELNSNDAEEHVPEPPKRRAVRKRRKPLCVNQDILENEEARAWDELFSSTVDEYSKDLDVLNLDPQEIVDSPLHINKSKDVEDAITRTNVWKDLISHVVTTHCYTKDNNKRNGKKREEVNQSDLAPPITQSKEKNGFLSSKDTKSLTASESSSVRRLVESSLFEEENEATQLTSSVRSEISMKCNEMEMPLDGKNGMDLEDALAELYSSLHEEYAHRTRQKLQHLEASQKLRQQMISQHDKHIKKHLLLTTLKHLCPRFLLWTEKHTLEEDDEENSSLTADAKSSGTFFTSQKLPKPFLIPCIMIPLRCQIDPLRPKRLLSSEAQKKAADVLHTEWSKKAFAAHKWCLIEGLLRKAKPPKSSRERLHLALESKWLGVDVSSPEWLDKECAEDKLREQFPSEMKLLDCLVEPSEEELLEIDALLNYIKSFRKWKKRAFQFKQKNLSLLEQSQRVARTAESSESSFLVYDIADTGHEQSKETFFEIPVISQGNSPQKNNINRPGVSLLLKEPPETVKCKSKLCSISSVGNNNPGAISRLKCSKSKEKDQKTLVEFLKCSGINQNHVSHSRVTDGRSQTNGDYSQEFNAFSEKNSASSQGHPIFSKQPLSCLTQMNAVVPEKLSSISVSRSLSDQCEREEVPALSASCATSSVILPCEKSNELLTGENETHKKSQDVPNILTIDELLNDHRDTNSSPILPEQTRKSNPHETKEATLKGSSRLKNLPVLRYVDLVAEEHESETEGLDQPEEMPSEYLKTKTKAENDESSEEEEEEEEGEDLSFLDSLVSHSLEPQTEFEWDAVQLLHDQIDQDDEKRYRNLFTLNGLNKLRALQKTKETRLTQRQIQRKMELESQMDEEARREIEFESLVDAIRWQRKCHTSRRHHRRHRNNKSASSTQENITDCSLSPESSYRLNGSYGAHVSSNESHGKHYVPLFTLGNLDKQLPNPGDAVLPVPHLSKNVFPTLLSITNPSTSLEDISPQMHPAFSFKPPEVDPFLASVLSNNSALISPTTPIISLSSSSESTFKPSPQTGFSNVISLAKLLSVTSRYQLPKSHSSPNQSNSSRFKSFREQLCEFMPFSQNAVEVKSTNPG